MAEMLAQQAYQPGDIQNAPIPRGAPLVQGLQSFLAARAARKADEAEEGAMKAQTQEARDFLRALTEPAKTMTIGEAAMQNIAQAGTPELVDGRLEYRKTAMPAPTPEMVPQAGPQVRLGRRPEDDQVYMPTATGRETDPQRMAAMLANPQYKAEFTPEQKRALALEGVLTSQNPLVQKIGQMQYGAMQPSQMDVSAVNLSDLTPDSARKFARSRNPDDIVYRTPESKERLVAVIKNGRPIYVNESEAKGMIPATAQTIRVSTGSGSADRGQLYKVTGPDGKPKYVTRDDAIGMQPAPTATAQKTGGPTGDSSVDRRQYRTTKRELQNSYIAVNDFLQALKTTPKEESIVGEKAGALSTKYKLALSAVRTLQNTGVINVGELPFLEDALRDPQKISQLFNPGSRETITGQINALADLLEAQSDSLDESYGYDAAPLRGSETRRANRVPAA
ncbi:MAG: hypothetical protein EBU96_11250, partial [Actinobacteria bacterium]|nr:hypothetical protein [Actinomycetota bacterium]